MEDQPEIFGVILQNTDAFPQPRVAVRQLRFRPAQDLDDGGAPVGYRRAKSYYFLAL
ncbi:hypothetical protein [Victivallis sp. Marseille-Q1083]|uniref:hypothetical protein n=1 Tax=Victivallis sp. Marseille-Q1083 TaxID=2717288 RepID=UPI0015897B91|nr:hypothetical protein [Victivallis sp. Marseille-Q1083]